LHVSQVRGYYKYLSRAMSVITTNFEANSPTNNKCGRRVRPTWYTLAGLWWYTQVQHVVSRIKKRQRWDVQTMWAYDLALWPWRSPSYASCYFVRVPIANFSDTTTIRFRFMGQLGSDWSRDLATLTLEVMAPVADAGRRPPSVHQVWST